MLALSLFHTHSLTLSADVYFPFIRIALVIRMLTHACDRLTLLWSLCLGKLLLYPVSSEYDDETREDASAHVNHSIISATIAFNLCCTMWVQYIVPFPIVYCPARKHSQILFSWFTFFRSFLILIISISALCPGCPLDYRTHDDNFLYSSFDGSAFLPRGMAAFTLKQAIQAFLKIYIYTKQENIYARW